jgi:hypothetical protein
MDIYAACRKNSTFITVGVHADDKQEEGQGDDDAYDFDNLEGAGPAHHSGNGNGVEDGENGALEPPKKKMKKQHQDTVVRCLSMPVVEIMFFAHFNRLDLTGASSRAL